MSASSMATPSPSPLSAGSASVSHVRRSVLRPSQPSILAPMYAGNGKRKEKEVAGQSGSGNGAVASPSNQARLTKWKTSTTTRPPVISKERRFKGRDVTIVHAGAGLSTSLRSALAVPGGQLKSYLARKNEVEIERLVEERVKERVEERMKEAEKVWVRQCLNEDTPMGRELAEAIEGEVVKRVGETDWVRKARLLRRQYLEMLGARNEAVRRYTDFVGSMETVYYQYGGKEERHLNEDKLVLWVNEVCQSLNQVQRPSAREKASLRTVLADLEQIESEWIKMV